jgi:PAS domain S-box-containing protein
MSAKKPTYEELKKKLAKTEALVAKLQKNEIQAKKKPDTTKEQQDKAKNKSALLDTKEYLEAYKASEQNFKNLIDASPLGIRIITANGDLIYANQAILDICGYKTAQELAAVPRSKLYTPESYQAYQERKKKRLLKEHTPSEYEVSILQPDGEIRNLLVFRREVTWGGEQQYMALYQDITERKRAEEALKESEGQFRNLFEHAKDAVFLTDVDTGLLIDANQAGCDMVGLPKDKIIGKEMTILHPPEMTQKFRKIFREHVQKGVVPHEDTIIQRADGTQIPTSMSASVIKLADRTIIQGVFHDISEHIRAEDALRESNERFAALFNGARDGIVVYDAETGIVVDCNQEFERLTGRSKNQLLKLKMWELRPSNMVEKSLQLFNKVKQLGESGVVDSVYEQPDGTIVPVEYTSRLISIRGKQYIQSIARDISERKQSEEALKESEARFHTIVENSNDGIVFIQNGIVQYSNPKLLEMGNYIEADILGKPFTDFVAPDNKKKVLDIYQKRIAGQKVPDKYELDLLAKDGGIINTEISASLVNYKQETVDIAIVRDISARKQIEETLENEATRRRILVEQSRDGIVVLDQDGSVFEANQKFADMLGYTMEEMKQLHVFDWEFLYPKERVVEMINTVDEKGDHFETQHRRKDGTIYNVEISTNGAMFGKQKLIFCVCRDITERKQMEKTIEESEAKYHSLIDNSQEAILLTRPDGEVLAANPAACKMFGRTEEEICRMGRESVIDKSDPRLKKALEIRRSTGEFFGELTFIRADGTKFPGDISSKIFLDKDRKEKTSMIIRDITQRKQMEQAIRESEERFSKAFISSPEMMVIVNIAEDRYVEVNDSFVDCLGYSREELIGHQADEFNLWVYPEEKARMNWLMQEEGKVNDEEFRFRTKNGDVRTWLCSADTLDIGGVRCMLGTSTDITERKRAQEALRESQERFSRAFQVSPAIVAITTLKDGRFVEVNDTYLQITGNTREEVIGKTSTSLNAWADPKDRIKMFRILQEKGKVDKEEFGFRMKSGEIRTWLFSAEPITLGGEECLIAVSVDITERKRAEEAIKESEERLQEAQRLGKIGSWEYDIEKQSINWSEETYVLYERDPKDGPPSLEEEARYYSPERTKTLREYSAKAIKTKQTFSYDLEVILPSQKKVYYHSIITPIQDTQGKVVKLTGTIQDITERKQAEEALKTSEERFRQIFQQGPIGIMLSGLDYQIINVNAQFSKMLGYTEDEFRSITFRDFTFPEDIPIIEENCEKLIKGESDYYKWEKRAIRKDKGIIWENLTITLLRDNAGKPFAFLSMIEDITERRQTEEALEREREDIKLITDTSRALIWYKDVNGKFLRVNRAFAEALDMPEKDIVGKTVSDLYQKDIAQSMTNDDREVLVSGSPKLGIIEQYESATGLRWVQTDKVPVLDKKGNPVATIGFAQDITERRQAEEALRESEDKYRSIVEQALVGIGISKGNQVIFANQALLRIFNYDKIEEFIKIPLLDHVAPSSRNFIAERMKNVIAGEKVPQEFEYDILCKGGMSKTLLASSTYVTLKGEVYTHSIFQDITERKQAEAAIKESEERFRTLFETMAQGVIYRDGEGRVISANLAAQRILGLTFDEMVGKTSQEIGFKRLRENGSDFPSGEQPSNVALRTGKPVYNVIMALYNPVEKAYRWILNNAIPEFREGEKKPYRVYTTFTDITERKQGEQRINYLNQTLRSIRNINQLITREKDRDILLQGVCDTLVQSQSFYLAWIVLLDESHRLTKFAYSGMQGDFSSVIEAIKQGDLPPCVAKALKKSQVIVVKEPVSCVGCGMLDKTLNYGALSIGLGYGGNTYGVFCASLPKEILTDKDEVSLFQEIANDISFALYNITLQSEYERMEEERLRADKLESIGTLAGGIAHDFNNLLTGIMGNIGMVKANTKPNETTYEMLEEAEKAATRARDLTQQLLTFARGGKPLKKPVQIAEIIKESATFALRGSKAKLELSLPDDLWLIEADEGQISQVINNLIINADEAMPEGGRLKIQIANVTLRKKATPLLPSGNYVRIDIADTGIGIDAEQLSKIFEPYFTTKKRGSGLGLTTAYSIVRNHGGIVLAESIPNKGSTFHVYLPATKKPLTKGGKKMTAEIAGQAGGKILVMDDEEIIRKMLTNMLSLAGYIVELSADGAEALKKYQEARKAGDPFSAVIMDLTIPGGMGGKEAVQKLLEIDPNATVIVSSGYANDPIMSDYKSYGFKAVIAKPYSAKQLQVTLSGLLARKKK